MPRRTTMVSILFMVVCILSIISAGKRSKKKDHEKLALRQHARIQKLSKNGTRLMSFSASKYNDLLQTKSERLYGTILLVTADASEYECEKCKLAGQVMKQVLGLYQKTNNNRKDLYFAKLNFDHSTQSIFQGNGIQKVPILVYFPPNALNPTASLASTFHLDEHVLIRPKALIDFIHQEMKIDIPKPLYDRTLQVMLILGFITAVVGKGMVDGRCGLLFVSSLPWNATLWMLVSMVVFGLSTGGLVSCVIRKAPWLDVTTFFRASDARNQTYVEGLVIGLANLMTAWAIICAVEALTSSSRSSSSLSSKTKRLAQGSFLVAMVFSLSYWLHGVFLEANPWMMMDKSGDELLSQLEAVFPKSVMNTFRRVFAVAQYWVVDYSDWATFESMCLRTLGI